MPQNYYMVLGVSMDASAEELRAAYRRQVRLTHPDVTRGNTVGDFLQVQEAWEVLSDPKRRGSYDAQLRQVRVGRNVRFGSGPTPVSSVPRTPKRPIPMDLHLTGRQARRGGALPLRVHVSRPCPLCKGIGRSFRLFCYACAGTGTQAFVQSVTLLLPPNVRDQESLAFPLDDVGLAHAELVVRVHSL